MIITRSDSQENLLIVGEKYNKLRAVSFLALNINTSIVENHDALYESHWTNGIVGAYMFAAQISVSSTMPQTIVICLSYCIILLFQGVFRLTNLCCHKQSIRIPHHDRDIQHHIQHILCMLLHP